MAKVTPPKVASRKDYSKTSDPYSNALSLAEKRYTAATSRVEPTDYNLAGNIAGKISNNLKGSSNKWSKLLGGFAEGVETSAQFAKLFDDDKKYKAYENSLNFFEAANMAKLEQQQYHDKMQNAQQQLAPEALAYYQNRNKDPQTAQIAGSQMWLKWKDLTGSQGDFLGWLPTDENIAMIKMNDKVSMVDIRPLFFGDQYTQNEIATLGQDYQNRLQDERQENQRKYELEERKTSSLENVNNKRGALYDTQAQKTLGEANAGSPVESANANEVPLASMGKKFSEKWQESVAKEISQIPTNERTIETVEEMKDIFNKYPDIGTSFLNAVAGASSDESLFNIIARGLANFTDPDQYNAVRELEKLSSDLELSTVMGLPGKTATDILKRAIQKASPNGKLPAGAFNMIADSWAKRAQENLMRARTNEDGLTRGMYIRNLAPQAASEKTMAPSSSEDKRIRNDSTEELKQMLII